jgi:uncharacterized membrane protein YfcA
MIKIGLFVALALFAVVYLVGWTRMEKQRRNEKQAKPTLVGMAIGFVTNFFDTLGVGSFATTTSIYRALRMVDDRVIPGTLNVGHTLPTVAQAFIFIGIIEVDMTTLVLLIIAAVLGSWLGAGIVSGWSRRNVQLGMGIALLLAATIMIMRQTGVVSAPQTGAIGVTGVKLAIGIVGNFILGALMTLGIGLYAPAMIMVSLLGMVEKAAFPIMMGSCAFLMPVGSLRFIKAGSYDLRAAVGLAIGGIPAALIAGLLVKSLPLDVVKWLVVVVVVYTAIMMLLAANRESRAPAEPAGTQPPVTAKGP